MKYAQDKSLLESKLLEVESRTSEQARISRQKLADAEQRAKLLETEVESSNRQLEQVCVFNDCKNPEYNKLKMVCNDKLLQVGIGIIFKFDFKKMKLIMYIIVLGRHTFAFKK